MSRALTQIINRYLEVTRFAGQATARSSCKPSLISPMSFLQKASRSPGLRLVITPWSTRLFQPLLGHHQLRLLEAVGSVDANSLVFDPVHGNLLASLVRSTHKATRRFAMEIA